MKEDAYFLLKLSFEIAVNLGASEDLFFQTHLCRAGV